MGAKFCKQLLHTSKARCRKRKTWWTMLRAKEYTVDTRADTDGASLKKITVNVGQVEGKCAIKSKLRRPWMINWNTARKSFNFSKLIPCKKSIMELNQKSSVHPDALIRICSEEDGVFGVCNRPANRTRSQAPGIRNASLWQSRMFEFRVVRKKVDLLFVVQRRIQFWKERKVNDSV